MPRMHNRRVAAKKVVSLSLLALIVSMGVMAIRFQNAVSTRAAAATPTSIMANRVEIPDDWEMFVSIKHGFSIQHPSDIQLDLLEDRVRLFQVGPTQQDRTEVYDALALTFSSGSLAGSPLLTYAEVWQFMSQNDPIIESVSSIQPVVINEFSGYWYTVRGLETLTQTYLPNGENRYLLITDGTVDPSDQGFEEIVKMMLSTLQTGLQQL